MVNWAISASSFSPNFLITVFAQWTMEKFSSLVLKHHKTGKVRDARTE
jgi:hypothetical protein